MIKDIVVNLSVGQKASPACDYAVSVAAAFNARQKASFDLDSCQEKAGVCAALRPGCERTGEDHRSWCSTGSISQMRPDSFPAKLR